MSIILYCLMAAIVSVNGKAGNGNNRVNRSIADNRIMGGRPVSINQYPYHVSVQLNGRNICGGSIVSVTVIVTAAHCFETIAPSLYSVRAGTSFHASGGVVIPAKTVTKHPDYNTVSVEYDVAVIVLKQNLTFNKSIQPIALAETDKIAIGTPMVVIGWGTQGPSQPAPAILKAAIVHFIERNICNLLYMGEITDVMVCAANYLEEQDSCQGDSGGSLASNGVLVGVTSWGQDCGTSLLPGVYTNIAYPEVREWIQSFMDTSNKTCETSST